jgi:hypothetical protein
MKINHEDRDSRFLQKFGIHSQGYRCQKPEYHNLNLTAMKILNLISAYFLTFSALFFPILGYLMTLSVFRLYSVR